MRIPALPQPVLWLGKDSCILTRPQSLYYNGCISSIILGREKDFLKGSEKVGGTRSSDLGDHCPPSPAEPSSQAYPTTPLNKPRMSPPVCWPQSLRQDRKNYAAKPPPPPPHPPPCADGETEANPIKSEPKALCSELASPRSRTPYPPGRCPHAGPLARFPAPISAKLSPRARPAASVERHCHLVAMLALRAWPEPQKEGGYEGPWAEGFPHPCPGFGTPPCLILGTASVSSTHAATPIVTHPSSVKMFFAKMDCPFPMQILVFSWDGPGNTLKPPSRFHHLGPRGG